MPWSDVPWSIRAAITCTGACAAVLLGLAITLFVDLAGPSCQGAFLCFDAFVTGVAVLLVVCALAEALVAFSLAWASRVALVIQVAIAMSSLVVAWVVLTEPRPWFVPLGFLPFCASGVFLLLPQSLRRAFRQHPVPPAPPE